MPVLGDVSWPTHRDSFCVAQPFIFFVERKAAQATDWKHETEPYDARRYLAGQSLDYEFGDDTGIQDAFCAQAMQAAEPERTEMLDEAARIARGVMAVPGAMDVQFRDLRRTLVVWLGRIDGLDDSAIAGITGHSIDRVKRILETYGPRDTVRNDATIIKLEAFLAEGTSPLRKASPSDIRR